MSELVRELRTRVDAILKPHRDVYGDDAPVVRMALRIVREVESLEEELSRRRYSTLQAAEVTGWSVDTLQRWARAKLDGTDVPPGWRDLNVKETPSGYSFALDTIPHNPRT